MATCPQCARENPDGARFCNACATPLSPTPAPREERKVVTVLFCDLVGFTARAERLDPEDVQALLRPYHAHLRAELERHGGTVEKFVGDAVMAVFGAPTSHEDDPERAVRAALAIRAWAGASDGLDVRIAVNTGEALVMLDTRPELGEGIAAGDVVNTAARMQAAAPLNGILVGERTYRATREVVDYDPADPVDAKGKEHPVPAWRVGDVRAAADGGVPAAPLVGRVRELELLTSTLGRVCEDRSPQLVTLIGVPGIGKSRLVQELFPVAVRRDDPVRWYRGRCRSYGSGVPFSALADIVRAHAGVGDGDGDAEVRDKLSAAVTALVDDEDEARWVGAALGTLVLGGDAQPGGGGDGTTGAWRRFLEALADDAPLVLVLEDLHWADDGLLDFLDETVEWARDVPLLLLSTSRPELLERRLGWGGGKPNATTISLAPLGDAETADLIDRLLGSAAPVPREALVAGAGGNPLFAEQYVRMLDEHASAGAAAVPETVHAIITARIDGLPPGEKQVLHDAAVIGEVFHPAAVAAIAGADPSAILASLRGLERKELVHREHRSARDTQYAFTHVLVRDAAYGQIPRRQRSDKHRRAAEWIETLGAADAQAETIAHHYRQALDLARASGSDDAALRDHARRSLRNAGERAASLAAFVSAARLFGEALDLTPADDRDRPRLLVQHAQALLHVDPSGVELDAALDALAAAGDLEGAAEAATTAARLRWYAGDRAGVDRYLARSQELLAGRPPSPASVEALGAQCGFHMLAGEFEEGIRAGREALALAADLGMEPARARALILVGCCRLCAGDVDGVADIEEGIETARAAGALEVVALGYGNLASELFFLGRLADATRAWEREIELSERYGLVRRRRAGRVTEAALAFVRGDWDDALRIADIHVCEVDAGDQSYEDTLVLSLRSFVKLARGDAAAAEEDSRRAVDLARTSDAQSQAQAFTTRALVALAAGNRDEADALASDLAAIGPVLLPALCMPLPTLADVAWVFRDLGRIRDLTRVLDSTPIESPWMDAARAIASGELVHAADLIESMGHAAAAAYARARAAQDLAGRGRQRDSERQLDLAREFFARAGASAVLG